MDTIKDKLLKQYIDIKKENKRLKKALKEYKLKEVAQYE